MKLRFRKNSLRLRVNQHEVSELAAGSSLREQVDFPGDTRISYVLEPSQNGAAAASFRDGVIRICAPQNQVGRWASGNEIGLYFDLPANGTVLQVALEKDLECIDGPPEERDLLAFPRDTGRSC